MSTVGKISISAYRCDDEVVVRVAAVFVHVEQHEHSSNQQKYESSSVVNKLLREPNKL